MRVNRVLHALVLAGCAAAVARPDRLWSPIRSEIDSVAFDDSLSSLADPFTPSIDDTFSSQIDGKIYSLRGLRREEGEMERGQTLDQVLRRAGLEAREAQAFTQALRAVFDPRRARTGDKYELLVDGRGRLSQFVYRRGPMEIYRADALPEGEGAGWKVERVLVPIEHREVEVAGRISDSLYASFLEAGGDADLVMAFVELFSWDVDFSRETREGDQFRVICDRLFVDGEPVGNGRIFAARYQGVRGTHTALYYRSKSVEGYFDPEGRSIRKSFLRSPLKFTRVSSSFNKARLHPILDIVRPHNGVDYAASAGTPVRSVADGTLIDAGWRGGAGKAVTIRHTRGYETSYNHLSRFGSGARAGARVKQGDVIGFVGETGLATGPHLDFRVKKNGVWVDPQKEKYVAGDPIPPREREAYRALLQKWLQRLDSIVSPVQVARKETP